MYSILLTTDLNFKLYCGYVRIWFSHVGIKGSGAYRQNGIIVTAITCAWLCVRTINVVSHHLWLQDIATPSIQSEQTLVQVHPCV